MPRMTPRCLTALTFLRVLPLSVGVFLIGACRDQTPTGPPTTHEAPSLRAGADQSWVRSSFDVDVIGFVACLGENVRFHGEVPFQYHEVTSSSGNFMFHQQLRPLTRNTPQFFMEGQASGKVFQYKNGGPINEAFHLAAGRVHTIVDNEIFVADNGDRVLVSFKLHETVNANGELTVFKVEPVSFECVAK